ncbi:hypothetical protein MBANPS3_012307 [Mucor bainieri]
MQSFTLFLRTMKNFLVYYLGLKEGERAIVGNSLKVIYGGPNCRRRYAVEQKVPAYRASDLCRINRSTGISYVRLARMAMYIQRNK